MGYVLFYSASSLSFIQEAAISELPTSDKVQCPNVTNDEVGTQGVFVVTPESHKLVRGSVAPGF